MLSEKLQHQMQRAGVNLDVPWSVYFSYDAKSASFDAKLAYQIVGKILSGPPATTMHEFDFLDDGPSLMTNRKDLGDPGRYVHFVIGRSTEIWPWKSYNLGAKGDVIQLQFLLLVPVAEELRTEAEHRQQDFDKEWNPGKLRQDA